MVRWLIRKTDLAKACGQNVKGMFTVERSAKPVSTIWRCFLSDRVLCSGVVRWEIPWEDRYGRSARNSPTLSEYRFCILVLNLFLTSGLNWRKMALT